MPVSAVDEVVIVSEDAIAAGILYPETEFPEEKLVPLKVNGVDTATPPVTFK
jgi:hypothetical protein